MSMHNPNQSARPHVYNTKMPKPELSLIEKGAALLSEGDLERALIAFQQAIAETPDNPLALYNAGVACHQLGQLEQAIRYYTGALEKNPSLSQAFYNLGIVHIQNNTPHKGIPFLLKALENIPDYVDALYNLGIAYERTGEKSKALQAYQQAVNVMPTHAKALNNMGQIVLDSHNAKVACDCFKRALAADPNLADAWFNLAELDIKGGDFEQGISKYRKAIQLQPTMIAAHNNMGNALKASKRYNEAIASFKNVLLLTPELPQGHYNLGEVYRLVENFEKAIAHLSKSINLKPDYAQAWNNLGLTFKNMGELDRAKNHFNRALAISSDLSEARWNRSFVNFLKEDWLAGWQDFEARFDIPHWQTIYPHRIQGALWDGAPIPGKSLLVHDEQGLGDTIQFARLLPWAKERCEHLILETRNELTPLLQDNPSIDQIIVRSETVPPAVHFDCFIPLLSIARLAGVTPQWLDRATPYVTAQKEKMIQWGQRLPSGSIRVGLVWAGRPQHGNDANRSLGIPELAPLFKNRDIQFIGLQKGPAASHAKADEWTNFINIGPALESFADTAAVLAQLDLLITVDTAVAHLAGAMGRPVWVLIPFIPDWRWGMQGDKTPWYPEMQLHRQQRPKEWGPVIDRMNHQLNNLALRN